MSDFKIAPIPFEKIAVAITLSPRVEELVCEGFYFAQSFKAKLYFIHIGNQPDSEKLQAIIDKHNLQDIPFEFISQEGEIVEALLTITKYLRVDLLIAGALQKESPWRYIMGSISRRICRKAKCSVLMLNEPSLQPKGFSNMVVNCIDHPKTPMTIDSAVYISNILKVSKLTLLKEDELHAMTTLAVANASEDELSDRQLNQDIEEQKVFDALHLKHHFNGLNVNFKSLKGKPGKEITNFAREEHADLLVVNSPDQEPGLLNRLFPHGLELALEDLPCSLLIIHSRNATVNA